QKVTVTRWDMAFYAADGQNLLARFGGVGAPPERVALKDVAGASLAFSDGDAYQYRFAFETADGDIGYGAWRLLHVGGASENESVEQADQDKLDNIKDEGEERQVLAMLRGEYFDADDKPTDALRAELEPLVKKIADIADVGAVHVDVHLAPQTRRSQGIIRSQRQAVAVTTLLNELGVAKELMVARGRGDAQPLMPNIGRRAREMNERIEISYRLNPRLALAVESKVGTETSDEANGAAEQFRPLRYQRRLVINGIEEQIA